MCPRLRSWCVGVARYLREGKGALAVADGKQVQGVRGGQWCCQGKCGAIPSHLSTAAEHIDAEELNLIPLKYQQHTHWGARCHTKTSLATASVAEGGEVLLVVPPNRKGGDTLSVRHELEGRVYEVVVPEGAVPGDRFSARFSASEDADTELLEAKLQSCAVLRREGEDENMSQSQNEMMTVFNLRSLSDSDGAEVQSFNEYCTESVAGRLSETHQEGQKKT